MGTFLFIKDLFSLGFSLKSYFLRVNPYVVCLPLAKAWNNLIWSQYPVLPNLGEEDDIKNTEIAETRLIKEKEEQLATGTSRKGEIKYMFISSKMKCSSSLAPVPTSPRTEKQEISHFSYCFSSK